MDNCRKQSGNRRNPRPSFPLSSDLPILDNHPLLLFPSFHLQTKCLHNLLIPLWFLPTKQHPNHTSCLAFLAPPRPLPFLHGFNTHPPRPPFSLACFTSILRETKLRLLTYPHSLSCPFPWSRALPLSPLSTHQLTPMHNELSTTYLPRPLQTSPFFPGCMSPKWCLIFVLCLELI